MPKSSVTDGKAVPLGRGRESSGGRLPRSLAPCLRVMACCERRLDRSTQLVLFLRVYRDFMGAPY